MADVITRFKLETTQFDSKLRDASKGLKEYTHQAELGGKSFTNFSQKSIQAAKDLGSIASGANNAKDKVKDLVGAYNDAAKAYNNLSQQQQQSDFGKALAQSIGQLSDRLKEAKQELYGLGDAAKEIGGGGLFSGDGFKGMLQVFGGNLMTKIAGMGMGLANEMADAVKQGIELAKAGEGVRIAFERLGRGDILDGLRQATHGTVTDLELMKAAVKFNDFKLPVEELGTMLAFAQQKAKDTGQSVDYMVDSIVTGLGRKSLMILDNLGLSANEVKEKMKETGDMTKAVGEIIREQMAKAGDYIETAADRAAQANVSLQNKMEELGRKFAPVEEASSQLWTSMKIGILDIIGGPLATLINQLTEAGRLKNALNDINGTGSNTKLDRMLGNLRNASEGNRQSIYQQQQAEIWKYINSRENYFKDRSRWVNTRDEGLRQSLVAREKSFGTSNVNDIKAQIGAAKKMLSDYQQAAKTILQPIKQEIVPTVTPTGGGSGKGGGFDISRIAFNQPSNDKIVKPEDYIAVPSVWEQYGQEIVKSMNTTGDAFEQAIDKLSLDNWSGDAEVLNFLKKFAKYGDDAANSWRAAGSAISTVGSAVSGLDDNAGKIMSIIGEAIANIAAAAGIATKKAADESVHWTEYVGAAAGIIATMVSAISTVHSSTGYAHGGMVEGNTYSGDQIPIMANAGEVILNQAQQSNVAHALQGGAFGGMHLTARLDGKDLLLSIDRTGQTLGYGQLVFFH